VREPGSLYYRVRERVFENDEVLPEGESLPESVRQWLFIADRQWIIDNKVKPHLNNGDIVISTRSYLSTLVHQGNDIMNTAHSAFIHSFVPEPSIVFLLDVSPSEAMSRIEDRGARRGKYETKHHLGNHREKYLNICKKYVDRERLEVIDADNSVESVYKRVRDKTSDIVDT